MPRQSSKYWKLIVSTAVCFVPIPLFAGDGNQIDTGTTAWMLTSTALVLLMVPGLAMFYGGLVRTKNVLGTMMHSFVAMAIIGVLWTICGYALAFGKSILGGFVGWNSDYFFLKGIDDSIVERRTRICAGHVSGQIRHHHAGPDQRRAGRTRLFQGIYAVSSSYGFC